MANTLLYGFQTFSEDLLNRRAETLPEVRAAIELSMEAHNAAINGMIDTLAVRTTDYQARFHQNAQGILQPLDEFGRSVPRKGSDYTVAFPIKMAGGATGFTWLVRPKLTVQEVNNALSNLFIQDVRWVRRQMLGALFDNTASGVAFNDEVYGSLTLYGLANGDAAPLYYKAMSDSVATDTHYIAEADAISDSNNKFALFHDELLEHPENTGDVISLIPSGSRTVVEALTEFEPVSDPNFTPGSASAIVNGFSSALPPGATPLGYLTSSKVWVAVWDVLPTSYHIGYTSGGEKPLGFRQDELTQFQGFFPKDRMDQFPYMGEQWIRRGGFAGFNRTGAVVYYSGNDTYAIPTGYGLLMAS